MVYESIRQAFTPEGDKNPSALRKLLAGAISGAVAQTCTYPLSVAPVVFSAFCCMSDFILNNCIVTYYGDVSRSIPCQAWDTSTNPSLMQSVSLSFKRVLKDCTRASCPISSK